MGSRDLHRCDVGTEWIDMDYPHCKAMGIILKTIHRFILNWFNYLLSRKQGSHFHNQCFMSNNEQLSRGTSLYDATK